MYRYKGKIKRLKNNKRFIAIVITLAVAALILSSVLAYFISSSPPPETTKPWSIMSGSWRTRQKDMKRA